ncbi:hypothetical protein VA596_33450 [Amycolatopsis sp., V23-08]|uniref:Uncharacterized protein n=1 Tax=Amycolatopsis heterodermiae TaxID=3110235 RepID=A0ABU5RFX9_9PSEU|nr:hypothetical protein [Amycolatopsis sp., V23-08]MEA5364479.1 hypothetical protein [Amycolatopsis sp., V23-08]
MDGNEAGTEGGAHEPADHDAAEAGNPTPPAHDMPESAERAPAPGKPPEQLEQRNDVSGTGTSEAAPESAADETQEELGEAETSDADWKRHDEQLRAQKESFLRSLGAHPEFAQRTGRKVAFAGGVSAENLNLYGAAAGRPSARGDNLPVTMVDNLLDRYVDNGQLAEQITHLSDNRLIFSSGADGTGRRLAAYAAQAQLCGRDKIRNIDLDEKAAFTAILDDKDVLRRGCGHVVELDMPQVGIRQSTLTTLSSRLASEDAYMVIIGPPLDSPSPLRHYELTHKPPDSTAVLRRHLAHELAIPAGSAPGHLAEPNYLNSCLTDDKIVEYLALRPRPGEVAQLAKRLNAVRDQGGTPADAVSLLPDALRDEARDRLRPKTGDDDFTSLRRMSAVITHAIYTGSPPGVVRDVTAMLFDILVPPRDRTPKQQHHARVVSDVGGQSTRNGDPNQVTSGRAKPPDDPAFAGAVLDVSWHVYDLQEPLVTVLYRLGGDPREQVRMRAGQLAGQLAIYDFGYVYRSLLRPWADSAKATHRQAAAWAIERVLLDPKMAGRARRQVQDWVLSPNPRLNDTAALTMATSHGYGLIDELWLYLWFIAIRETQVNSSAVAQAVARFCQPDQPGSVRFVLGELTRWVRDEDGAAWVRVQAARALLFTAHETAPEPYELWPGLLHTANQEEEAWDQLAKLWQIALTERVISYRAWDVLRTWLQQADGKGELEHVAGKFAIGILREQPIRSRAVFYLDIWQRADPDTAIFSTVYTAILRG